MNTWTAELNTAEAETPPDAEAAARELAKLSKLEYDQCRKAEAERLGVTLGALDSALK